MSRPWIVGSGMPPRIRYEPFYPVVMNLPRPLCDDLALEARRDGWKARVLPTHNRRDPYSDEWLVVVSLTRRRRAPAGYANPRRRA